MDPNSTILRVKRKRGTDPADALLLACKRIRPETSQSSVETVPEPNEAEVENSVFKLVATVATQDAPVQAQVRQALARPRVAHALRPSAASSQRILGDLRSTKWSTRREERYRIISSQRTGLSSSVEPQNPQTDSPEGVEETGKEQDKWDLGEIQVVDLLHENGEDQDKSPSKMLPSDPEVILCNNTKMLREHLSISGDRRVEEHQEQDSDYVYDLYYQETVTPGWIQDILFVRAYADEGELVPDLVVHEEVYDDDDDENDESNWRNDYPDEESDLESDREERYGGYWEEEHSYSQRNWQRYHREVLHELGCRGEDEDEEGDKYDSD
uniref:Probable RNA polymerase II nuclear localization protein SLC7A6OS n=1 Tax=Mola mola TaxID=94237 RepID=A0A3Q3WQZ5_MOLML